MRKGYLIGSVAFLVLAVLCIADTVRQVLMAEYGMRSPQFLGSVAAHAVMALIGAVLLVKAHPPKADEGKEEQDSDKEAES